MPLPVSVAVEGQSDVVVVERILAFVGCSAHAIYGRSGKADLDRGLPGYNNAARFWPWLVLRDLDTDAPCAPELARLILPNPADWMRFRIAVREVESWLLADPERLSNYLRVPRRSMPNSPDSLADPKLTLVNLARRSRVASVRADMVPERGVSAVVGPGYVSRVSEFAGSYWRPEVAARNSVSVRKCIQRVRELRAYLNIED
jgi:hypothetical protein